MQENQSNAKILITDSRGQHSLICITGFPVFDHFFENLEAQ